MVLLTVGFASVNGQVRSVSLGAGGLVYERYNADTTRVAGFGLTLSSDWQLNLTSTEVNDTLNLELSDNR